MDGAPGGAAPDPADASAAVRPVGITSLVLLAVGVLAIPVGLIFFYLAVTKGEPTPKPSVGQGVVGIDATVSPEDLAGRWSLLQASGSQLHILLQPTAAGGETQAIDLHTPSVEAGLVVQAEKVQTLVAQADLRLLTTPNGQAPVDAVGPAGLDTASYPLVRLRFDQPGDFIGAGRNGQPYVVTLDGQLTLHGVAAPVRLVLQVSSTRDGQLVLHVSGGIEVKARDFGVPESFGEGISVRISFTLAQHTTPVTISRDITGGAGGTTPGTKPGTKPGTGQSGG